MQLLNLSFSASRIKSAFGTSIDVGLFGVTTTAISALTFIASSANLSTSSRKEGNSSGNSTIFPLGAAFAYSLNDGTGTIIFFAKRPDNIFIISAAPLPTTIHSAA